MAEVLSMEELENKFGSKSKSNTALGFGIAGLGAALLNGGGGILSGLLGGNSGNATSGVLNIEIVPSKYQILEKECQDNLDLTRGINAMRVTDLKEKFDLYQQLIGKITDLEKSQVATATALPLTFQLAKVNAERYTDACCCKADKEMLMLNMNLQRQLDHKIDGELKYSYANLCAPVPSLNPLYCSPFTRYNEQNPTGGCI